MAVFACVYGYFFYDVQCKQSLEATDGITEFEITEITYRNDSIAFVDGIENNGNKYHYTLYTPPEIKPGDTIKGKAEYNQIVNDGDFDSVRYYKSKGIWLEADVSDAVITGHNKDRFKDFINHIRDYFSYTFDRFVNDDTAAVLNALSIGDTRELDRSLERDFQRAGISHMLAISGMHLSVVMGSIGLISDLLCLSRKRTAIFTSLICLCYIFIAGTSPSIVRAGIMFIIMSLGTVFDGDSDSLTNLMLSVTLMVVFSPYSVFDTGLLFSFSATLGIIVITGYYVRKNRTVFKNKTVFSRFLEWFAVPITASISAQAFCFIPVITIFDSFSLLFVLSNIVVSPIISLILFTIPLLIVLSPIPYVGLGLGFILDILAKVLKDITYVLAHIPGTVVSLDLPFVGYTYFAVIIGILLMIVVRKRFSYAMPFMCWFLCLSAMFLCYNLNYRDKCDIVLYSESSSDAVFTKTSEGNVYFDLGSGSNAAQERAFDVIEKQMYSSELDSWVITHYSDRIVNCIDDFLNEYLIREIYLPPIHDGVSKVIAEEIEYYCAKEGTNVFYYNYGERLDINGVTACIYEPIRFKNKSTVILSMEIYYADRELFYAGSGYFENSESKMEYDILFSGGFGSKKKSELQPEIDATEVILSENNRITSANINGRVTRFTKYSCHEMIRLKNIY
ncbi:MAG: ComEC/Rec2 family competence protein [Clostridia bacterium]|nr:ComEC/Rec2 family competence protein [Clostridia bacterium]